MAETGSSSHFWILFCSFALQIGSYTPSTLPSFGPGQKNVLSMKLLSESKSLCVILAGGDIVTLSVDEGGAKVSSTVFASSSF